MDITPQSLARFFKKVEKTGPCWLFQGTGGSRYGKFTANGKTYPAHRFSYIAAKGPIDDALHVDHLCRVTKCVNPDHLEAVTCKINILRGISDSAINARKTQCVRGHEFSESNTRIRKTKKGQQRICIICAKQKSEQEWIKRKEEFNIPSRVKVECKRGHAYSPQNTWTGYLGDKPIRRCKMCGVLKNIAIKEKRRAKLVEDGIFVSTESRKRLICRKGHPYTDSSTTIRINKKTGVKERSCKICRKENDANKRKSGSSK